MLDSFLEMLLFDARDHHACVFGSIHREDFATAAAWSRSCYGKEVFTQVRAQHAQM
jgi:hypothetical protein